MHPSRTLTAAVLGLVLLGACSSDPEPEPEPTPTATATPSPTPTPTPTPTPDGDRAALTGVPTDDAEVHERFVLAVKIENSAASRPQSGLEDADIVFEELVEGGITRFVALFHSTLPETVGPIRSARLVDVDLLPPYESVLAISGARDQVLGALASAGVPFMADGTGFFRESSRRAPSNLYGRGEDLYERAAALGERDPAAPVWRFDEDVPDGFVDCEGDPICEDASRDIGFLMSRQSSTGWTWDEDEEVYRRSQNGEPFRVTGPEAIGAANVVILETRVGPGACCDSNGSPLVATTVTGTGRAVILRDGNWYEATWVKTSRADALELVDADGEAFPLKPGPTWVHLVPQDNVPGAP